MTNIAWSFWGLFFPYVWVGTLQGLNPTTVQWAQIEKILFLTRGLGTGTLQVRDMEENFKIFLFYFLGLLHVKPQSWSHTPAVLVAQDLKSSSLTEETEKMGPHESVGEILIVFSLFYFTALSWKWGVVRGNQGKCVIIWGGENHRFLVQGPGKRPLGTREWEGWPWGTEERIHFSLHMRSHTHP